MARLRVTPTTQNLLRRRAAVESFMVCPLCTSLNVRENDECFVCRWSGEFDENPAAVEMALYELLRQCPDLPESVLDLTPPSPPTFLQRFKSWLTSRRRRSIDIHA